MRLLFAATLFVTGCGKEPLRPEALPETPLERGQVYTGWFYTDQMDRLWEQFSPEMRQLFGTPAGLRKFRADVQSAAGTERKLLDERVIPWLASDIYHRSASFSGISDPVWVQWTMDPSGRVLAFLIQPAQKEASSRFRDYQTQADLQLPFSGEWFVFWGGRSVVENYHAAYSDQRFAYDLVVVRDGKTHAGDPSRNENYFCFGQPVLAPGHGTVRAASDGVPDNPPGQMNARQPLGNHVVLDHGNGEFSFLAHLKQGSVAVRLDERVQRGQILGRCGNSGNSSEAHLHYHLQNTPEFNSGEGLPTQFLNLRIDGRQISRGEPTRGERIQPQ